MRIATWNVNSVKARLETDVNWLKEASPDVRCSRRSNARTTLSRGLSSRRWATMSRSTARRATTASPSSPSIRSTSTGAAARRRRRRSCPLYRSGDLDLDGRHPGRLDLSSQRQSVGTEKFTYKLDWMDGLSPCARPPQIRRAARAGRRLQRHSRAARCHYPERLDARCAVPAGTRGKFRALINLGLTDAVRAATADPAFTRSGTIRPAPGSATTASASTTSCCRRRPPIGSAVAHRQAVRAWEKPSDHVPVLAEIAV